VACRPLAPLLLALAAAVHPGGGRASASSAVPPAILELLPPGARTAEERLGVRELASGSAPALVERLPRDGGDGDWIELEYTVDPALERRIRAVLAESRIALGHVIVLDPSTGAVFAYVSTSPELLPPTRVYPTASLMKVVTAAAVLGRAPEAARRTCRYLGSPHELRTDQLVEPAAGGRAESFAQALAISNNQCFARLAVRDLGGPALLDEIRSVGLLDPPGAGHPPGWVAPLAGDFFLGRLGAGIAGAFVSPLGAARLAAALASGELVQPYWIDRARDAAGEPLALPPRAAPRAIWPPEITGDLRETLAGVTESGTAAGAFRPDGGEPPLGPVRVAGKTGTVSGRDPVGLYQWFIGVAPAEAPSVAIAAIVVHERPGGTGAAEVAAASLREIFCADDGCATSQAERLRARASVREAEVSQQLAHRERERALAREREEALARARRTAASHEVIELDQVPRPVQAPALDLPPRLRRRPVSGTVILLVRLSERGRVLDVQVDSSDLPEFDAFVANAVKGWRFTPPTQGGVPVQALTRLPVPIHVN
jgi:TonB family protein